MKKNVLRYLGLMAQFGVLALMPMTGFAATPERTDAGALGSLPAAPPAFTERPATAHTLRQLRQGGYVLYMRHGPTDNTRGDRIPAVDLEDCTTQRPLSEAGRQSMVRIGEAVRKAKIPIGELRASPMCRTRDSAAAGFPGMAAVLDSQLMYVSNFTDAQKQPIIAHTRRLLSTPVPAGRNLLLLGHAPNLMDLIGYFPKEGTLVVFRPKGDGAGFDYIASIAPGAWKQLMK